MDQDSTWCGGSLSQDHIVLDGDLAPAQKKEGAQLPNFQFMSVAANGWMDQNPAWDESRPRPRPRCVRWGSNSPKKGHTPNFQSMSIVAKRSPISDNAEHLLKLVLESSGG